MKREFFQRLMRLVTNLSIDSQDYPQAYRTRSNALINTIRTFNDNESVTTFFIGRHQNLIAIFQGKLIELNALSKGDKQKAFVTKHLLAQWTTMFNVS